MNDDERDFAEEEANRRMVEEEHESELEAARELGPFYCNPDESGGLAGELGEEVRAAVQSATIAASDPSEPAGHSVRA